jgi:hypothetical protein
MMTGPDISTISPNSISLFVFGSCEVGTVVEGVVTELVDNDVDADVDSCCGVGERVGITSEEGSVVGCKLKEGGNIL